jgi:hypothetical protein
VLSKGDALMISNGYRWGEQATLTWFRSIYGSSADAWRANYNGFPMLPHTGEIGLIKNKTWNLANSKGKVAKQILKRLVAKQVSEQEILLNSDNLNTSFLDHQFVAIKLVTKKLMIDCEVSAWILEYSGEKPKTMKSPLCEQWLQTVGTPLLSIP